MHSIAIHNSTQSCKRSSKQYGVLEVLIQSSSPGWTITAASIKEELTRIIYGNWLFVPLMHILLG